MFTAILGYSIDPSVTEEEYERWLHEVHAPDLLANPHLDRISFNTVVRSVERASDGTPIPQPETPLFRISELHFADEAAYRRYREWFDEHPPPASRGPAGRTVFRFYVLTETRVIRREDLPSRPGERR